eukprot:sb/3460933/
MTRFPEILNQMQHCEESRVEQIGHLLTESCQLHADIIPHITESLTTMVSSCNNINPVEDSALLMEERTNNPYPSDHQFIEYGCKPQPTSSFGQHNQSIRKKREKKKTKIWGRMVASDTAVHACYTVSQEPTETSKQPIRTRYLGHMTGDQPIRDQYFLFRSVPALSQSNSKNAKDVCKTCVRVVDRDGYQHLPPEKRKKAFKKKIKEIQFLKKTSKTSKTSKCSPWIFIEKSFLKISKLKSYCKNDLENFSIYFPLKPYKPSKKHLIEPNQTEISIISWFIVFEVFEVDFENFKNFSRPPPLLNHGICRTRSIDVTNVVRNRPNQEILVPDWLITSQRDLINSAEADPVVDNGGETEFGVVPASPGAESNTNEFNTMNSYYEMPDQPPPVPPTPEGGQLCSVLYDYTAQHDDELDIYQGEFLFIMEDNGTGWVKAQRNDNEKGLIPGNYIEMMASSLDSSGCSPGSFRCHRLHSSRNSQKVPLPNLDERPESSYSPNWEPRHVRDSQALYGGTIPHSQIELNLRMGYGAAIQCLGTQLSARQCAQIGSAAPDSMASDPKRISGYQYVTGSRSWRSPWKRKERRWRRRITSENLTVWQVMKEKEISLDNKNLGQTLMEAEMLLTKHKTFMEDLEKHEPTYQVAGPLLLVRGSPLSLSLTHSLTLIVVVCSIKSCYVQTAVITWQIKRMICSRSWRSPWKRKERRWRRRITSENLTVWQVMKEKEISLDNKNLGQTLMEAEMLLTKHKTFMEDLEKHEPTYQVCYHGRGCRWLVLCCWSAVVLSLSLSLTLSLSLSLSLIQRECETKLNLIDNLHPTLVTQFPLHCGHAKTCLTFAMPYRGVTSSVRIAMSLPSSHSLTRTSHSNVFDRHMIGEKDGKEERYKHWPDPILNSFKYLPGHPGCMAMEIFLSSTLQIMRRAQQQDHVPRLATTVGRRRFRHAVRRVSTMNLNVGSASSMSAYSSVTDLTQLERLDHLLPKVARHPFCALNRPNQEILVPDWLKTMEQQFSTAECFVKQSFNPQKHNTVGPRFTGMLGERILPGKSGCPVYRGQIAVNFLYRGNFILPVNRGSGKSGPGKSGSDCISLASDPDLVTSSGEMVLVTKSGWPLNRGVTKSGSDYILVIAFYYLPSFSLRSSSPVIVRTYNKFVFDRLYDRNRSAVSRFKKKCIQPTNRTPTRDELRKASFLPHVFLLSRETSTCVYKRAHKAGFGANKRQRSGPRFANSGTAGTREKMRTVLKTRVRAEKDTIGIEALSRVLRKSVYSPQIGHPLADMAMKSLFKRKVTSLMLQVRRNSQSGMSSSTNADDEPKGPQIVYENTFQLSPKDSQKFPTKKAEDIIKNTFLTHLLDSKYSSDNCKNLTAQITETVKTQVKAELGSNNRYKVVVLVIIGSNQGQGARVASRCLWYPQYDRHVVIEYCWEIPSANIFTEGFKHKMY